jgi:uncharacterized protein YigA (DUF484 family)
MTTQIKPRPEPGELSEDAVCAFLTARPEFFERHPEVLDALRLPHRTGGAAVSLIERQMEQLRERNAGLERKLRELIAIARDNETLVEKLHGLGLQLLGTDSLAARLAILEAQLRESFAVDQSVLVLFGDRGREQALGLGRFLRIRAEDDPALQPFATLLDTGSPRCGQIRDSQRDFLFGTDTNEIGSAALVPLLAGRTPIGLLGLGSRERDHFNPGKGTDVLRRIADTVAAAIRLD